MTDLLIHIGDESILRTFDADILAPPVNILSASAAARKGERLIDPLAALVRNVRAIERPRNNVRRLRSRGLKLPAIPPEIHAEYQTAFAARVCVVTDTGKTEAEARESALSDLGCEQFFAHLKEQPALPVSATSAALPTDTRSQVERARIKTANALKVERLRAQWVAERSRKGEAA